MFLPISLLLIVICVSASGNKYQLPSYFELCSKSDAACILNAFNAALINMKSGDPKVGVPSMEPMHLDVLDLAGISSGPVSLSQKYSNVDFYGSTVCNITNMTADFNDANCHMAFQARTTQIIMTADYEMTGQILMLPLNGRGKCKNVLEGLHSRFEAKCEKYTKKGSKHIRLTNLDFKIADVEKVHFDLSNLIEGNEKMSEELLKTLNENGKSVLQEIRGGLEQAMALIYLTVMNSFFSKFPENELFLD